MSEIVDTLSMYLYYVRNTVKAWFQYKLDACLRSFAVFMREAAGIIIIYLTLKSFKLLNGWNTAELFFLYSILFLTYGILIIFFTGLRDFEFTVSKGDLDRILLRPRGILFQVLSSNSDWFAAIGHGGLGILLFVISANKIGIVWNFSTIAYYVAVIISGVLLQGAMFLIIASFSFYFIRTGNIRAFFYYNGRNFAGYPISIYPKLIRILLIYVVPFAFVNYFPVQYLLRKDDMSQFPVAFIYIAPFIGIVYYTIAYAFWRFSLKQYKSSGN